uniref:sensor histidine kinase n=1 Tax=Streptomyces griseiscabiei TaxID=2993540 RepID=UPI0037DA44B6
MAATSLGALRIGDNVDDIQQLDNMRLLTDMTKQATELATALQNERDESAGPLAHGVNASDYTIKGAREKTDLARTQFTDATQAAETANTTSKMPGVRDSLVRVVRDLYSLSSIRKNAYVDEQNSTQTVEAYHRLIEGLLELSTDMAEATSNPDMIKRTRALAAFSSAKEYASVQRAVIAAALPETNEKAGKLSENDRLYANAALGNEESDRSTFSDIYGAGAEDVTKPIDDASPTVEASDVYADRVLASSSGLGGQDKRSYKDWIDDSGAKIERMKKIEGSLLEEMEQTARNLRADAEQRGDHLRCAHPARPRCLAGRRVRRGPVHDPLAAAPAGHRDQGRPGPAARAGQAALGVGPAGRRHLRRVGRCALPGRDRPGGAAFDDVHREAVRLAAEQALLRGNVNAMFTNLSRRSQGLIQRQLSLISELESREADPDQLSSLFKLDHLATRMRRNGENLLVLAGEEPGRRWTRPVPLVDVLRAAASEVEQYERIELASVPTTEVAGRVVNDLVHLLAELLENATSFSSPQTKVKVTGHALPDGRVLIEIHDTGIGLSPEDLAAINERLASPPTVDVSVSRRMGLFVVGRLSQRHGIRIQLRPSDSGGTTALVMLPVDVAQGNKKPTPGKPGQGGPSTGGPAAAQAAAGAAAARRQAGNQSGPPLGGPSAGGGLLGGPPQRGQVGAGQGPRAALPGNPSGPGGFGNPGGPRGPQGGPPVPPQGGRPPAGTGAGGFGGGQAPGAPQGCRPPGPVCRAASRASTTPDARAASRSAARACARPVARVTRVRAGPAGPTTVRAPCRRSRARNVPAGAARSCPAAVAHAPSCPAATTPRRGRPAGATRPRSRPCRVPRWTPRAATRSSRTSPRRCRASTPPRLRAPQRLPAFPGRRLRQPPSRRGHARTAERHRFLRPLRRVRRGRCSAGAHRSVPGRAAGPVVHRPVRHPGLRRLRHGPVPGAGSAEPAGHRPVRGPGAAERPGHRAVRRAGPPERPGHRSVRAAAGERGELRRAPPAGAAAASPGAPQRPARPQEPEALPRRRVRWTAVRRCTTRWRPTGSTVRADRTVSSRATGRATVPRRRRRPRPLLRLRPPHSVRRHPPRPLPPPGAARPTTTWSARPNEPVSLRRAGSPPPACRAGSRAPTSCRARLSSNSTKPVRRSRVRLTTFAAG